MTGDYRSLDSPEGAWVWRRGRATVVALNFSDGVTNLTLATDGRIALSSDRSRDGTAINGSVDLKPWEGVVLLEEM